MAPNLARPSFSDTDGLLGPRFGMFGAFFRPPEDVYACPGSRRIDVAEFIVYCKGCGKEPAAAIQAMRRA